MPRAGHQVDVLDPSGPNDGLVKRHVPAVDGGDGLLGFELSGRLRSPEPLGQGRLGVVVHQEDATLHLGERPRDVVAGRSLTDPALLVQHRDDGHGSISSLGMGHLSYRPAVAPCTKLCGAPCTRRWRAVHRRGRAGGSPCKTKAKHSRSPPRLTGSAVPIVQPVHRAKRKLLPDSGPLAYNRVTPGTIGVSGEMDEWTFTGHAGRLITAVLNTGTG